MGKMSTWIAMRTDILLPLATLGAIIPPTPESTLVQFTGNTAPLMRRPMPMLRLTGRDGVLDFPLAGKVGLR